MGNPADLLASALLCQRCSGTHWNVVEADDARGIHCQQCGARHPIRDGILWLDSPLHPEAQQEREAVPATETNALIGGWWETIGSADDIAPELLRAYLSLPYGDDSFRFTEPGYFVNVQRFAPEFDFVTSEIQKRIPNGRLLDLGADGTWSTARLAACGYSCIALDITDHLRLATLYQRTFPPYALVNADMHASIFRDHAFDVVTAFNALHHSSRFPELAQNIVRMLRPGGVLGIVEPYVQSESQGAIFGRPQSESGINENIHTLDRWCRVLADVGLQLLVYSLSDSFNAIFRRRAGEATSLPVDAPRLPHDPDSGFYASEIRVHPTSATVARHTVFPFTVTITNRGDAAWASRGPHPIALSYHVTSRDNDGTETIQFDNPRALLPRFVAPGEQWNCVMPVSVAGEGPLDIEFDLVHETRTWFKDRGGRVARARIDVVL